jgi:hypothetical protein
MSDHRRRNTFESDESSDPTHDDSSTVELDKYSLLSQVYRDQKSAVPDTVRMTKINQSSETVRISAISEDARPTMPLPALTEATRNVSNSMVLEELDIEIEPIDEDRASTLQIPVRMEFEVVVEPGGVLRIPREMMQSGHIRAGMKLRIVAGQIV